jgi:phenylacetate-CoA ligase
VAIEDILHPALSLYMGAPQWVKTCVGRTYSAVPRRLRYGARFAGFEKEVARCYGSGPVDEMADAKLALTLRHALQHVPAFAAHRHLLAKDLAPRELLAQLPLTSKQDIKADLAAYLSTRYGAKHRLEMFTGGSTAIPMRFYSHKHVTRPKEAAYYQDFDRRAGLLHRDDVILSMRGRSVRGAGEPGARIWTYEPIKRHLVLSSDHLEPRFMAQYLEALRQWRPSVVQAVPSALYPLACWLLEHPAPDITQAIRGIHLTSETAYEFQMDVFRRVFDCPVLRGYGHTERVVLGATMPDDDRYFFWPLYGHVELVDTAGRPITQPGVPGEIVGTSFDNEVMPFVRYRTGDVGMWGEQRHPMLPHFPVMERIDGRLQEFVLCRDERIVTVATLGAAHFADLAAVDNIQYEQFEPGKIVLKVVSRQELDAAQRQRLAVAVSRKTQGGCDVEVQRVDHIPRTARGKHRLLIQHLDVSGYLGAAALVGQAALPMDDEARRAATSLERPTGGAPSPAAPSARSALPQ